MIIIDGTLLLKHYSFCVHHDPGSISLSIQQYPDIDSRYELIMFQKVKQYKDLILTSNELPSGGINNSDFIRMDFKWKDRKR